MATSPFERQILSHYATSVDGPAEVPLVTTGTSPLATQIEPQDERDDWFTRRVDPYDDRIRELERFKHRIDCSWPADAALSEARTYIEKLEERCKTLQTGFKTQYNYVAPPYPQAEVEQTRDELFAVKCELKDVRADMEKAKAQALDFARRLMEANAKIAAVNKLTDTKFKINELKFTGDPDAISEAVSKLQQADPLQEPADGRPHILP